MAKIYKDGTDQYLLFRATATDYTAFTGTKNGDALPDAVVVISEYKKDDEIIENPSVTWNATVGKWKAVIPAANITQYGTGELTISGTGMIPVSIEFETVRSAGGGSAGSGQVIPSAFYTLDASENTITLTGDYAAVTEEQVISIRNITKNQLIYDSQNTNRGQITISAGVITFTYSGQMEDTDKIQIVVNMV